MWLAMKIEAAASISAENVAANRRLNESSSSEEGPGGNNGGIINDPKSMAI